jgi:protein arginine kinase
MSEPGDPAAPHPHQPAFDRGTEWLKGQGDASDVVISSRVRVARNLAGFPFMPTAGRVDRAQILEMCKRRLLALPVGEGRRVLFVDLHTASHDERDLLVERQLISQATTPEGKLNERHGGPGRASRRRVRPARLSACRSWSTRRTTSASSRSAAGWPWRSALADVDQVDDDLEKVLDFAFDPRFGYLTACPTNVGTGLRLSVMLHLPGLRLTGMSWRRSRVPPMTMGLAVRGFHGEGSDAAASSTRCPTRRRSASPTACSCTRWAE